MALPPVEFRMCLHCTVDCESNTPRAHRSEQQLSMAATDNCVHCISSIYYPAQSDLLWVHPSAAACTPVVKCFMMVALPYLAQPYLRNPSVGRPPNGVVTKADLRGETGPFGAIPPGPAAPLPEQGFIFPAVVPRRAGP